MKKSLLSLALLSGIALTVSLGSAMSLPINQPYAPDIDDPILHISMNSGSKTPGVRTGGPMLPPLSGTGSQKKMMHGTGTHMEHGTGTRMRPDMPPVNGCTPVAGSSTGYSLTGPCMPPPMHFQTGSQMEHGTGVRLPDTKKPVPTLSPRIKALQKKVQDRKNTRKGPMMQHTTTGTGSVQ